MDILKKSLLVGFVFLISMLASPNIFAQDKTDGKIRRWKQLQELRSARLTDRQVLQ